MIENEPPFFIISVPRSGSTLLATILNKHSKIHVGSNAYGHQLSLLTHHLKSTFTITHNNNEFDFQRHLDAVAESVPRLDFLKETNSKKPTTKQINSFFQQVALGNGKRIFGDKCPPVIDFIEDLKFVVPNARFINIVRDGRAVAMSHQNRTRTNPYLAIHRWKQSVILSKVWEQVLGEEDFLTIRFEDLITNQEKTLLGVCRFLGVSYEAEMKNLAANRIVQSDDSYVKPQFDSTRIDSWRDFGPKKLKKLERIAGDVLTSNGYLLATSSGKRSPVIALTKRKVLLIEFFDAIKRLFTRKIVVMRERKLVGETKPMTERIVRASRTIARLFFSTRLLHAIIDRHRLFND